MKKKAVSSLLLLLALLLIIRCSNTEKEKTKIKTVDRNSKNIVDTSFLNDKNFIYKNLTNTLNAKFTSRPNYNTDTIDNDLYTDSTFKKAFVLLTNDQKVKLIAPFIAKELQVNALYVSKFMSAYFISKQRKIGDIQPIIIYISGDDYGSLTMILLDKNYSPVDGFNLDGGMQAGPTEIGDSLISYEAKSYSRIMNNQIITYRINKTDHTDSTKKQVIVDSSVFKTFINKKGAISTRQFAKVRLVTAS